MTPKKYSDRKREERESANSEVIGVILIIISAFLLLIMITGGLILGDIGRAISNVLLGVLGYTIFPLLLFLLLLGIVKVQNRKISVKKKYVVGVAVIVAAVILIAHFASSHKYIGDGFGAYMSGVYGGKDTVGGVLFGLIIYGLYAIIRTVATYILLSLVILGALFFMSGLYSNSSFAKKSAGKRRRNTNKNKNFTKSSAYAKDGFAPSDRAGGLFVANIIRPDATETQAGNFDDMPDGNGGRTIPEAVDENKIYDRTRARKILFEENEQAFAPFLPQNVTAAPDVKYVQTQTIPEVPMPPEKDFQRDYVGGEILNGDEITERLNRENPKAVKQTENNDNIFSGRAEYTVPPVASAQNDEEPFKRDDVISFTRNERFTRSLPKSEEYKPYFNPAPIINGDYYVKNEEPPLVNLVREDSKSVSPMQSNTDFVSDNYSVQEDKTSDRYYSADEKSEDEQTAEIENEGQTENIQPSYSLEGYDNLVDELENESLDFDEEPLPNVSAETNYEEKDESYDEPEIQDATEADAEQIAEVDNVLTEQISEELSFEENKAEPQEDSAWSEPTVDGTIDGPIIKENEETELGKTFEQTTSSFNIVDEVEDLSEKSYSNPNDSTGYYNQITETNKPAKLAPEPKKQTFDERVSAIDDKINSVQKSEEKTETPVAKEEKPTAKPKPKKRSKYSAPSLDLLVTESTHPEISDSDTQSKSLILENALEEFGVPAKVNGVTIGPAITRYELDMPPGMSVKKIETLSDDIRYALACKGQIRIESPIPGKRAVGIELPNDHIDTVALKDIIGSPEFKASASPLTIALGKDIQGKVVLARLEKMPHLLIAGTTGSGKSSCLNSLLISLLYKSSPDDVKLILIDPKQVEFTAYNGVPHMVMPNAITDVTQAINAFKWAYNEMERRYSVLSQNQVRDIQEYNSMTSVKEGEIPKLPFIVMIVDEFANLITSSPANRKTLEDLIMAIASKARAAGIHLVLATQRPAVDVITGTIKANLPSRIAFSVANAQNSRIILDAMGAETLLGRGDMLYAPIGETDPIRVQGAYVENFEVKNIVNYVKEHNSCDFDEEFEKAIVAKENSGGSDSSGDGDSQYDKELIDVVRTVIRSNMASSSFIQRRFRFGFNKAARLMEQMEELHFIGPQNNSKPREVYITKEKFEEFFGEAYE